MAPLIEYGARVRERPVVSPSQLDALTLANLPGVGDVAVRTIIDALGTASAALAAPYRIKHLAPRARLTPKTLRAARASAAAQLERAESVGLHCWSYGAMEYPPRLAALHDPPAVLWGRGDPSCLRAGVLCAVVGARRATPYGLRTATKLGRALGEAGVVVVSGMAMGVDGAAHRGALEGGGTTVAVLGSGADVPTPGIQRRLYRDICENGLVVSEFPPSSPAQAAHFPRRNRIIAALAEYVVVVEASRRSGALITVEHALDIGGNVFAVPGPVDGARSEGTNALIADGAGVVTSPEALVALITGMDMDTSRVAPRAPADSRSDIWGLLSEGPLDLDTLAARLGQSVSQVAAIMAQLEIEGRVERQPGGRFARRGGPPGRA